MTFKITRHTADGRTVQDEGGSGGNAPGGTPIDLGKLRSIAHGSRTRNIVREGRRADGVRIKATTDELNTTVTEHAKGDRQDVHVRPAQVTGQISLKETPWLQKAMTSKRP